MNTDLLRKYCHIAIPNLNKKALRLEEMPLDDAKRQRLLDWNKGSNKGIVKTIKAYWVTYKRQRTHTIMVQWIEVKMSHYFTEEEFCNL